MKPRFDVEVGSFQTLREIDGFWTSADFLAMLKTMNFADADDVGDAELREYCLMSLQDLEPVDGASVILKHVLGDRLNSGQIANIAHEMQDERLWEEYSDMELHERLFHAGSLSYAAFPRNFPKPDAMRVTLNVSGLNGPANEILAAPLHESFVVRLISDGMDDRATLRRMFDEQLAESEFPEAENIIWIVRTDSVPDGVSLDVTTSKVWLEALENTDRYESSAYPDA